MRAVRASGTLALDGRLEEADWGRAPPIAGFVEKAPDFGSRPQFETIARILYDDEALWVAFECADDEPDLIRAPLARRDQTPESDRVLVYLDGLGDGRSGFEFMVTAGGVLSDAALSADTSSDRSWDGVWDAAVRRHRRGWTAEIRIPFRNLRWREGRGRVWGLELRRVVSRTREVSELQPIAPSSARFVSAFGRLEGLEPPEAGAQIELRPYVAGRATLSRAEESIAPRGPLSAEAGLDARWAPSPDFRVDATVNPDFGQVELDPQVVNLSPYETFFPEHRPFFLEGMDVFGTPLGLVHTRRIGEAPDVPEAPEDDPVDEMPETARIWGASRATGEVGAGTSVGALVAVTDRVRARTQSGATLTAAEPAGFSALRLRRQLFGTSTAGVLATHVDHLSSPRDRASVGAADWDLRSHGGDWELRGQVAGSRVDRPGEMPFTGGAADLFAGRVGGEPLRADVHAQWVGPGFDPNDLGFLERDDVVLLEGGVTALHEGTWGPTRSAEVRLQPDVTTNADGDLLGQDTEVSSSVVFRNMWSTDVSFELGQPHVDDRESRGGPDVRRPGSLAFWAAFDTDFSKPAFGGAETGVERRLDAPVLDQTAWITVRPVDAVELTLQGDYRRHDGFDRWVATETDLYGGDRWVFARADVRELEAIFRGQLVLQRDLTLQLYAQLLRATGDHSRYRQLALDGTLDPIPGGHADDQDFDTTGVSAQVVLRWELWPGSAAYLVWRHQLLVDGVAPSGSLDDGRDPLLGHALDRGDSVLFAKLAVLWWP